MSLWILQLSLCVVTVTASKFSHVIIEPMDANSCGRNEQLLNNLVTSVSQIQNDVAELKTGGTAGDDTGVLRKKQ